MWDDHHLSGQWTRCCQQRGRAQSNHWLQHNLRYSYWVWSNALSHCWDHEGLHVNHIIYSSKSLEWKYSLSLETLSLKIYDRVCCSNRQILFDRIKATFHILQIFLARGLVVFREPVTTFSRLNQKCKCHGLASATWEVNEEYQACQLWLQL